MRRRDTKRSKGMGSQWVGLCLLCAFVMMALACGRQRVGMIPPVPSTPQGGHTDPTAPSDPQEDPATFGISYADSRDPHKGNNANPSTPDPNQGTQRDPSTPTKPGSPPPSTQPAPNRSLCVHRGGRCSSSCPQGTQPLKGMADCDRVGGVCCVPTRPECHSDADCGAGSCSQQGSVCSQVLPFCHGGRCFKREGRVQGKCDAQSGQCQAAAPQCHSDAECGRPACKQSGIMCVTSLPSCSRGQCADRQVTVRGRCHPNTGTCQVQQSACKSHGECGKPSCLDRGNSCLQFQPTCQSGQCHHRISQHIGSCDAKTGLCQASQPACKADADCGQPTCKQDGSACVQNLPTCQNGGCGNLSKRLENYACNGRTGKCEAKNSTQCRQSSDCGKPTCTQRGTYCLAYSPICQRGICATSSAKVVQGKCDAQSGQCHAATPPSPPTTATCQLTRLEREVLQLVNLHRVKARLAPLYCHPKILDGARSWSKQQCAFGGISHSDFQSRMRAIGAPHTLAAENVGAGFATAADAVKAWMGSAGHRNNILNKNFTHLGVGHNPCNQRHYWTQIFMKVTR